MALPQDAAVGLWGLTSYFQEQYRDDVYEKFPQFGRTHRKINRLFAPNTSIADGDGENVQVQIAPADSWRYSGNPNPESLGNADNLEASSFKLRFNLETAPNGHDFTFLGGAMEIDRYTMLNRRGSIAVLAVQLRRQFEEDFERKIATWRMTINGVVGHVNGTPELNNGASLAASTGTATNAGGIRFAIDNGSISFLRRGDRVDFIRPATGAVIAGNVRVTDINPSDLSVGGAFSSTGHLTRISTGNLANVVDNDYVVLAGTYAGGKTSLRSWFSDPAAGETFIGDKDRTTSGYRWMIPITTRQDATTTSVITQNHYDDLAEAMGWVFETGNTGLVFMQSPPLTRKIRNEIAQAKMIIEKPEKDMSERWAHFGIGGGVVFQNPQFGVAQLVSETLMPPDEVWALDPETWMTTWYQKRGLQFLEGDADEMWSRVSSGAPNSGKGVIYRAEAMANIADWCKCPFRNGRIRKVAAA